MERTKLPPRRETETISFEFENLSYVLSVSRFTDGSLGEIFLNASSITSAANKNAHDAAVLYSIARQYGVPHEVLFDALLKLDDGTSASAIGKALELLNAAHKVSP